MGPGTLTTGDVVRGLSEQLGAQVPDLGCQLWKGEADFGPGGAPAVVGKELGLARSGRRSRQAAAVGEAVAGGGDVGRAVWL